MGSGRPAFASIHLDALRHNLAEVSRRADGRAVIAVVKADAYGHGAVPVARTLVEAGCPRLAVLEVAEGAELREAGLDVPVLVLGGVHDSGEAREAVRLGLTPVVHHAGHVALLSEAARKDASPTGVEVEVDSGMRRMGVPPEAAPDLLASLAAEASLVLDGVYTHFARADEAEPDASLEQLSTFRRVLDAARARGVDPGAVHVANSAGLLAEPLTEAFPQTAAVRPGLMLYGVNPAPHFDVDLKPVMTLHTRVVHVRRVMCGDPVGYGGEFRAPRDTTVATLPIGYADGVPVSTSRRGRVLIAGGAHAVAGRVSMDFIGVDVGGAEVAIGDPAILFGGTQGSTQLRVEEASEAAQTIPYELLVRVGARVRREYVE